MVKTPRLLRAIAGIEVLAARGDLFLVTGNDEAVSNLRRTGSLVVPLASLNASLNASLSAGLAAPTRSWRYLDQPEPVIQALVDQVVWLDLADKITWLQDFQTRYSFNPQCQVTANGLLDFFTTLALPTDVQIFDYEGTEMWNVEATQVGAVYPDSIFVICGHYDSISEQPDIFAPGADDNASGTTAVLTAAEIFAAHTFDYTIKYVLFAAEEQGLVGSFHYAQRAASLGWGIAGALNFDMLGWWVEGVDFDLEIETNHASFWLAEAITNAADLYTGMIYELHVDDGAWWGDHYPFWLEGYCAVNHEESWDWYDPDFNPYYHSTEDIIDHIDPDFAVGNVKIAVAALATLARPQSTISVAAAAPPPAYVLRASPNPFRHRLQLSLSTPAGYTAATLGIFDVQGRMIDVVPITLRGGRGTVQWPAHDAVRGGLAAGVYFCRPLDIPASPPLGFVHLR